MPGFKLFTDLEAEKTHNAARRAAEQLGYRTEGTARRWDFIAKQGSVGVSILLQAFAPPSNFKIAIDQYPDGAEIVLERNSPWWTGLLGVGKVKKKARELAQALAEAVKQAGGKILREQEF